mmetsp:Transcript_10453/g.21504  ORF Transcript_10453/g.21504 Transcript_10453/m.21504 type:complete len:179 (+) Transcript_10453:196-732(+)|eukprot:CAMPEP_0118654446 /NCGR_PEP_ID=MMETSP0785-20121206/12401_1 /TAXON_ID=91992 /ORGANISM="Bolidomonas pacifica, Strain CCMP 1866" /LENGTH=178 /DNA_ID=CAMNT_0006547121 /DNA_START=173 /DNA_END=709 /DNA_ORIENTATION=-
MTTPKNTHPPSYTTIPTATVVSVNGHSTEGPITDTSSNPSSKVIAGAAAVGGVAGLMVSGPIIGLVGAVGAGIATMTDGTTGDVARSAGNMGASGYDKACDINKKHDITGKTKKVGSGVYKSAAEFNSKHDVTGKTKSAAVTVGKRASEFNQKHDITGKTASALKGGMDAISRRLSKK